MFTELKGFCEVTVNLTFDLQIVIRSSLSHSECLRQIKWNSLWVFRYVTFTCMNVSRCHYEEIPSKHYGNLVLDGHTTWKHDASNDWLSIMIFLKTFLYHRVIVSIIWFILKGVNIYIEMVEIEFQSSYQTNVTFNRWLEPHVVRCEGYSKQTDQWKALYVILSKSIN